MNLDGYGPSAFYLDDYDGRFWSRPTTMLPGAFALDSLTPVSYEEAFGYHIHNSTSEDKGHVAGYEGKPVFYSPHTRELNIDGKSVTVSQEFMDYIRFRDSLGFSSDETKYDDEDPIDISEFLA